MQTWKSVEEFIYDTSEKESKVRRKALRKEKHHDCPEAKIKSAVCRLEKFWNRLPCLLKD